MEASPASQSQGQGQALQEHAQRGTEVEAALLVVDQRIDQVRTQLYIAREGFTEAKKKNRITSGAIAIERHLRQRSVLQAERQRLLSERR
jgi:hypothetical protein